MSKRGQKYAVAGFSMVISPGIVRPVEIYFSKGTQITLLIGVAIYTKEHTYLGWIEPVNILPEVRRAMLSFIANHVSRWERISSTVIPS